MDSISARTWGGDDYLSEVLDDGLADPNGYMYVAERTDDSKILGMARLVCLGADEWWMEGMRVDPDHYEQGIGRLLNNHLVQQAEALADASASGTGTVRLVTSSLNKAVHKMAAETGFANLGPYIIYRANALPDPRHSGEFHVLTAGELPAIRQFLDRSAYYEHAARSLEYSWKWYLITDDRLRVWLRDSLIYGWTIADFHTLDGLLILNPLPTAAPGSGRAPVLDIGYLDARAGQLASMAQAARDLCARLGYLRMQHRFMVRGERLVAMEQAGWRAVRHHDPVYLYARSLRVASGHK